MKSISFIVIGYGAIAEKHIHSINLNAKSVLVGISDIDESKLIDAKNKHKIETSIDYLDLITSINPDVAVICTPSKSHSEIALNLAGKVRFLIIEKPIALTIKEARNILSHCKKFGTSVSVVQQNRYNKPMQFLKKLIENGELGELFSGSVVMRWKRDQAYYDKAKWRGTWSSDGGALSNQGVHFLDALLWFLGKTSIVSALSKNAILDIEAEDTLVGIIKFQSGSLGTIEFTTATRPSDIEGSITILGTRGSCEIGGFAMNKINFLKTESEINIQHDAEEFNNPDVFAYSHSLYYDAIIRSIEENNPLPSSGEEALETLKTIHAIYSSCDLEKNVSSKDLLESKLGKG